MSGMMRQRRKFQESAELHSHDFDFEAAVVGMVVFANTVSQVDLAALLETELQGQLGEVPTDGAD